MFFGAKIISTDKNKLITIYWINYYLQINKLFNFYFQIYNTTKSSFLYFFIIIYLFSITTSICYHSLGLGNHEWYHVEGILIISSMTPLLNPSPAPWAVAADRILNCLRAFRSSSLPGFDKIIAFSIVFSIDLDII